MMKSVIAQALGLCVFGASLAVVTPAKADIWTLQNYDTGNCIGAAAGKTAPGTPLVDWPCDGTLSQNWNFTNYWTTILGPMDFRYVNGKPMFVQMCMGVAASKKDDGTPVILWDCNGKADQIWYPYYVASQNGNNCYIFFDFNSNTLLTDWDEVQGGKIAIEWGSTTDFRSDQIWCEVSPPGSGGGIIY